MKNLILLFLLSISSLELIGQENNHGTIRVQKKPNVIHAVMFDNINNRLIGKDRSGNILDSAVVSYDVLVTIQGIIYEEKVVGTTLSPKMQNSIKRVDGGTTLFFNNIKVKEKNGNVLDWPKFSTKLGFAFEKEEN